MDLPVGRTGKIMVFVDALTLTKTLPCLAEPGKLIVIGRPSRSIDGLLPLASDPAFAERQAQLRALV